MRKFHNSTIFHCSILFINNILILNTSFSFFWRLDLFSFNIIFVLLILIYLYEKSIFIYINMQKFYNIFDIWLVTGVWLIIGIMLAHATYDHNYILMYIIYIFLVSYHRTTLFK